MGLGDLEGSVCDLCWDEMLVDGRTFKEHVDHLRLVLKWLLARGIELRAESVC